MVRDVKGMKNMPADRKRCDDQVSNLEFLDLGTYFSNDADTFVTAYVARSHSRLGVAAISVQFATAQCGRSSLDDDIVRFAYFGNCGKVQSFLQLHFDRMRGSPTWSLF